MVNRAPRLTEASTPASLGTPKQSGSNARLAVIVGCLLLLVGALFVGRAKESNSVRARTDRIASDIKCPTCQGLSVQQSKAGTAKAIYSEIERQVVEGQSDASIRGYLVSRFGTEQLLRPDATGITSVVWIAPVMFGVVALAGLALTFARWSRKSTEPMRAEDEALVAAFRSAQQTTTSNSTSLADQHAPSTNDRVNVQVNDHGFDQRGDGNRRRDLLRDPPHAHQNNSPDERNVSPQ